MRLQYYPPSTRRRERSVEAGTRALIGSLVRAPEFASLDQRRIGWIGRSAGAVSRCTHTSPAFSLPQTQGGTMGRIDRGLFVRIQAGICSLSPTRGAGRRVRVFRGEPRSTRGARVRQGFPDLRSRPFSFLVADLEASRGDHPASRLISSFSRHISTAAPAYTRGPFEVAHRGVA